MFGAAPRDIIRMNSGSSRETFLVWLHRDLWWEDNRRFFPLHERRPHLHKVRCLEVSHGRLAVWRGAESVI